VDPRTWNYISHAPSSPPCQGGSTTSAFPGRRKLAEKHPGQQCGAQPSQGRGTPTPQPSRSLNGASQPAAPAAARPLAPGPRSSVPPNASPPLPTSLLPLHPPAPQPQPDPHSPFPPTAPNPRPHTRFLSLPPD